jgi:uncharacterized membrane protein YphA (DoxX/SURF4 family)
MNIALWIIAGVLAAAALGSGLRKLIQPKERLPANWGWVKDFSAGGIKAIALLEVLAAVGLILPAVLGIAPVLVPLAAVGLALLMLGACIVEVRHREAQAIVTTLVLFALAVFVAWGRFGPQAFTG